MEIKVLVKGGGKYISLFSDIPGVVAEGTRDDQPNMIKEQLRECDVVCLTGGSDVDPKLYGHPKNPLTWPNVSRDASDVAFAEAALEQGKRLVGICRGAQLLCVMAGGTLVQDVSGHVSSISGTNGHSITTINGEKFNVTSTHHQMMHTVGTKNVRMAWAEGISRRYESGTRDQANMIAFRDKHGVVMEPEVVWFPDLLGLAVQYHPEQMPLTSRGRQYFYELLWKLVF